MEVASPLTFTPGQAGTKRAFQCSPGLVDSTPPIGMEISEDYGQQSFKRRRFNENSDPAHQNTPHHANPFAMHAKSPPNGAFFRHRGKQISRCKSSLADVIMTLFSQSNRCILSLNKWKLSFSCRIRVAWKSKASDFGATLFQSALFDLPSSC